MNGDLITKDEVLAQVPGRLGHASSETITRRVLKARGQSALRPGYSLTSRVERILLSLEREKLVADKQGARGEGWTLRDDWYDDHLAAKAEEAHRVREREAREELEVQLQEEAAKRALAHLKALGIAAAMNRYDSRILMDPIDVEWLCDHIEFGRR